MLWYFYTIHYTTNEEVTHRGFITIDKYSRVTVTALGRVACFQLIVYNLNFVIFPRNHKQGRFIAILFKLFTNNFRDS